MPKFFIKNDQIKENKIVIVGEDVNHIANVLRMRIGDEINIANSETAQNYVAKIESFKKSKIECEVMEEISSEAESAIELTIFQGIPKSDKMELIIQKSTELGVKRIVPVDMERCVSKINGKDEKKKIERWQKISEVAAKQCGRDIIPKVGDVIKIPKLAELVADYDMIIVPYEKAEDYSFKEAVEKLKMKEQDNLRVGIVIGPEGGFDIKEINNLKEAGAEIITLGKRILRTETVALAMSSVIMYELGGSI